MSIDQMEIERVLDLLSKCKTKQETDKVVEDILASSSLNSLFGVSENLIERLDLKAKDLMSAKLHREAIPYLQVLALLCPDKYRNWLFLGLSLQAVSCFNEALSAFSMATILKPEDPFIHYFSAHCYLNLNEKIEAELCLKKTIQLAKDSEFKDLLKDAQLLLKNPDIATQRN